MGLICFFNWYYTFLQLEPKELSEQLKRQVPPPPSSPQGGPAEADASPSGTEHLPLFLWAPCFANVALVCVLPLGARVIATLEVCRNVTHGTWQSGEPPSCAALHP